MRFYTMCPGHEKLAFSPTLPLQVMEILYSLFRYNTINRELNYLRMNNRFEKIAHVPLHDFRVAARLTYNLRGAWHTRYAMLLSSYQEDSILFYSIP